MEAQGDDRGSTLNLYRAALGLRRELQSDETLTWVETGRDELLADGRRPGVAAAAFRRSNGWLNITNLGAEPTPIPAGEVLLAGVPLADDTLPVAATAWLRVRV